MGISVENFLKKYFTLEELKEPLEDIGLPVGGKKSERIKRIVENWSVHNRDWYELPYFLKWGILAQICDDFGIPYSDYSKEETLCRKIAENRVLDFRNKPEKKSQKISEKPSINIKEQNINIGSHNKFNSDNTTHSETKISKYHLLVAIIGVIIATITLLVITNVGEPPNNSLETSEITEQALAEILKSGNVEEFNKNKRDWVGELNFDGINLSKMDLTEIDLRYTSLKGANFDNTNLTTAFFQGADLEQASFRNANFERANLVEANLKKAFLRSANFEQANLNRANMQESILYNADFRSASLIKTELQNADLQHAEFLWANLENAKLEGALLNNTDFREVDNLPISLEEAKARSAIVD